MKTDTKNRKIINVLIILWIVMFVGGTTLLSTFLDQKSFSETSIECYLNIYINIAIISLTYLLKKYNAFHLLSRIAFTGLDKKIPLEEQKMHLDYMFKSACKFCIPPTIIMPILANIGINNATFGNTVAIISGVVILLWAISCTKRMNKKVINNLY